MDPGHEEIAAVADPALRNLWITQRYHELAVALRDCGAGQDATWCAFAVWASKTAGAVIRGDDLPRIIRDLVAAQAPGHLGRLDRELVKGGLASRLVGLHHLSAVTDQVCLDVSAQIADGNVLVFRELAPAFEALVGNWSDGPLEAVKAATASVASGPDGVALAEAFDLYGKALSAGPPEQSRLMLAANVLAVAHEQQRLQPAIVAALNAAVQEGLMQQLDRCVLYLVPRPARRFVDEVIGDMCRMMDGICQTAVTEAMLRLVTADERLDLSRDLPALAGVMWPVELADVGEAKEVLGRWDLTGGAGQPTRARDWARLEERMNYIVNLFRSRQRHAPLFDPPFSDGQLASLRSGRLPDGPL